MAVMHHSAFSRTSTSSYINEQIKPTHILCILHRFKYIRSNNMKQPKLIAYKGQL